MAPRELIVGRFDESGRLRIAGRTTRLSPIASVQLAALLHPAMAHPWPVARAAAAAPPRGRTHRLQPRVEPEIVVEVSADLALDGRHCRHPRANPAGARGTDGGRSGEGDASAPRASRARAS
jgi:hypothetical protein